MKRSQAAGPLLPSPEVASSIESARIRAADIARPSLLDDERGNRVSLPADYPEWRRDQLSLSGRARALMAKLKPFVIRVLTFWDHRVSSLPLDELTLDIDASGSYRAH